jgi:hypothetical protein
MNYKKYQIRCCCFGMLAQKTVGLLTRIVYTAIARLRNYEGESNENRKIFFKFNLLNESGTQLYYFPT